MRSLEEEARRVEEQTLRPAHKIKSVARLEEILREALPDFEEILKTLDRDEWEEAKSLYLDRIRRVTFGFHLALIEENGRKESRRNPTQEAYQRILGRCTDELQRIGRLYRFT